ncbi:MAG: nitroreductase family protein [Solirubrobacterales bacterium]|nr:nitroreductase family protein [Solirubrobacterales bacterium]
MDTYLAIASRREVRNYAPRPLDPALERRILEAGRVTGSSRNRQAWRFDVARSDDARARLTAAVYAPENVEGAALVVVIVVFGKGPTAFDAGRAAQAMLLAAWNEGVGGCPNGVADADAVAALLGLGEDERVAIVLTFGVPARPADPGRRTPQEWIARADRKPYDEVVREV